MRCNARRNSFSNKDLLDREALQQMRAEIAAEVDEAVATAQQEDAAASATKKIGALCLRRLIEMSSIQIRA